MRWRRGRERRASEMRILLTSFAVLSAALAEGCSAERGYSSFSGGPSFNRDFYFATAEEVRAELVEQCRQRNYVPDRHPTGVIVHYVSPPSEKNKADFTYFATVVEECNNLIFWSQAEFPYDLMPEEREAEIKQIENALVDLINRSGPPDRCHHYSLSAHVEAASASARFDLKSASQVGSHVDELVVIRGSTERRKTGIYMVGSDVLVRLPQWCDVQGAEPQWLASVKGRLRLVREAGMYHSVNESRQPDDPLVQDLASGPMPALYELVP